MMHKKIYYLCGRNAVGLLIYIKFANFFTLDGNN